MARWVKFDPVKLSLSLASFFVLSANVGCITDGSGTEGDTQAVLTPSEVLPPLTTPERTVCDPFNVGNSARDRGLVANLVYLTDSQPRYSSAHDYILNGTPIQSTLYFDKLMIPTRRFDLGFVTQQGQLVLNQNSQPLYEYFGLRIESHLQLAEGEAPGWYQLSVLSDDGATLSMKNADGSMSTLIDNDGVHATRMGCASKAVYVGTGTKIPVVLEYYQGPRYHISLVAMWRPLPAGADPNAPVSDTQCGRQGNSMYFDFNQVPSTPTATYYEMLTRGWKPLSNENYSFPAQASNPCATAEPIFITNFQAVQVQRTSITVSWKTNIPTTTQARIKNVATGQFWYSPLDSNLTTDHTVTFDSLSPFTLYALTAQSTSPEGQIAESEEIATRTLR